MKVIIAGSRTILDYEKVKAVIAAAQAAGFVITEVVSGHANGVDKIGEQWAKENNIPIKMFIPDWATLGKSAGPLRNNDMAQYVGKEGGLIVAWDGVSRGTQHMIASAKAKGLKVHVGIIK